MTTPYAQPPVTLVLAARPFASDIDRIEVPAGATLAEMVLRHAPLRAGLDVAARIGDAPVPMDIWHVVRPKPGTTVTLRVVPAGGGGGGKNPLRILATLAILYVSYQLGGLTADAFAGSTVLADGTVIAWQASAAATAVATAGYAMAGSYLLNAIAPPPKPQLGQMEQRYSITATNNATPYGPVPILLGRMRWAPRFAAKPYTELVGQDQYVRILYDLGPGPIQIDMATARIGDTPLADFTDVETEVREGWAGDQPLRLFPGQVEEIAAGAGLPSGEMRQEDGWIIRTIDQDADELSVDFSFPAGIWRMSGGNRKPHTAGVQVQYAPAGAETWTAFPGQQMITAERESELRVSFRAAVTRGRYQVRARRAVDNSGNSKYADSVVWLAARATLNEAPLQTRVPHALVGLRIRASGQISGSVTNFSVICTRIVPGVGPTRNPADLFRWFCASNVAVKPAPPTKLDDAALDEWRDACADAGRTYDAVIEGGTRYEALKQIAAAGRAQFQIRDAKYSVVRDAPQAAPVTIISPRVSWGFRMLRTFPEVPHGLKIRFFDAAADYEAAERIVYDDGYGPDNATLFEGIDLPGITDADLVHRDGRYHLAAMRLRPATYEVFQDFEHLICRRGDRVELQHDVILVGLATGRVREIAPDRRSITVDDTCPMEADKSYALRIRCEDGSIADAAVTPAVGQSTTLVLPSPLPSAVKPGDLWTFGESGRVTLPCLVKAIEPGADLSARLTLVDYVPDVYAAEAGPIPPYDPGITTSRLPSVTGLTLAEVVTWQAGTRVPTLTINWQAVADPRASGYTLMLRDPTGRWGQVLPSRPTGHDLVGPGLGLWQVRVWAVSEDGRRGPVAEAAIEIDGIGDVAPLGGLAASAVTTMLADGTVQPAIRVTWTADGEDDLSSTVIRWRPVGTETWQITPAAWGAGLADLSPVMQPETYEVQAARELATGVRSDWSPEEPLRVRVDGGVSGARVVGLELFGQGLDTTWEGRDVRIVWRGAFPETVPVLGSEPYGAGTGPNPYFLGYVVRVYDPTTGALLREELPQVAADYTYRYDDNVRDGGPRRFLRFVVSIAPKVGQEVGAATLDVSNPAPPLAAATTAAGPRWIDLFFGSVLDSDFLENRVWVSASPGVDVTGAPTARGTASARLADLEPDVTYHVRWQTVDAFGDGPVSDEIAVRTELITPGELADRIIGEDKLTEFLGSRIDLIDGPASLEGSVSARLAAEALARQTAITQEQTLRQQGDTQLAQTIATVNTKADNAAAAVVTEQQARIAGDAAEASARQALAAQVNDASTGLPATRARLLAEETARANADSALSSSVSTLSTTVGGHTATLQTQATSINGLSAQYTVKIDNNGKVAGFGLASTAVNGTPTSHFAVVADKFSISLPGQTTNRYIFAAGVDPTDGVQKVVIDGAFYAGKVQAGQVVTSSLSALSANLGTVTAGTITAGVAFLGSVSAASLTSGSVAASTEIRLTQGGGAWPTAGVYMSANPPRQIVSDGTSARVISGEWVGKWGITVIDQDGRTLMNPDDLGVGVASSWAITTVTGPVQNATKGAWTQLALVSSFATRGRRVRVIVGYSRAVVGVPSNTAYVYSELRASLVRQSSGQVVQTRTVPDGTAVVDFDEHSAGTSEAFRVRLEAYRPADQFEPGSGEPGAPDQYDRWLVALPNNYSNIRLEAQWFR